MNPLNHQRLLTIGRSHTAKIIIYFVILVIIFNLNAVVDAILHPDIPYFDKEHLIVGGVTGLVTVILIYLLTGYMHYLDKAMVKIETLEGILPICAYCKKIRKIDADPQKKESWQQLESYITETTTTEFTHGICPECYSKIYAEFGEETPTKSEGGT